jgi:hypothetical protein
MTDRTAIDDTDDFGLDTNPTGKASRRRFTKSTLLVWLVLSALMVYADYWVFHQHNYGPLWRLMYKYDELDQYVTITLTITGVSQLVWAITGFTGIVVSDRWAYQKYNVGTSARVVFETIKWIVVTLLMIANAFYLEKLYERLFI